MISDKRRKQNALRPEDELLVLVASVGNDSERGERIKALVEKGLDWDALFESASRHGLLPLLYWHIHSNCRADVSEANLDQLRKCFANSTSNNLRLTGELIEILKLFRTHSIISVPFKGPTLAVSLYGNLALREFCDMDILIRKEDVPRAKKLLASKDYFPEFDLTPLQEEALLNSQSEYVFHRSDKKVMVELQWRFAPRYFSFPLTINSLWNRLKSMSFNGTEFLVLSAEDQLLILCVHGNKHVWARLGWIGDIARLLQTHENLDWAYITEQARILGSERMLLLGLFLASDLLGAEIPSSIRQRIQAEHKIPALAYQVRERLFFRCTEKNDFFARLFFHLKCRERWSDKVRYCLCLVSTSTVRDWKMLPAPLPSSLSFLYYPLRAVRLANKYGMGILRG